MDPVLQYKTYGSILQLPVYSQPRGMLCLSRILSLEIMVLDCTLICCNWKKVSGSLHLTRQTLTVKYEPRKLTSLAAAVAQAQNTKLGREQPAKKPYINSEFCKTAAKIVPCDRFLLGLNELWPIQACKQQDLTSHSMSG